MPALFFFITGCGIRSGHKPENQAEPATISLESEPETSGNSASITEIQETETETKAEGTPVSLTGNMQYEANIFLSNFAEQFIQQYDVKDHNVEFLINFAHTYAKINEAGAISYGMYESITLDYANSVLERFFGDSVTAGELQSFPYPADSYESFYSGPYYSNGNLYWVPAGGGTTLEFVVVDSVLSFPDGHYEMTFIKYKLSDFSYESIGGLAVTEYYYSMTPDQAASASDLNQIGTGSASVYPKYYNGHDSYELIKYQEY